MHILFISWTRITVPLPPSALTTQTRFRWSQQGTNMTSHWAIDDVYIGSDVWCRGMCSGHGKCLGKQGCK